MSDWNKTIQSMFEEERNMAKKDTKKTKRKLSEGVREVVGPNDEPIALDKPDPRKPSVNEVSQAFHDLHGDVRRVMQSAPRGDLAYAQALIDEVHAKLRDKLQAWGMADMIDWERED